MNIVKIQNSLKDLSDQQLLQTMQSGSAPQYLVAGEMQRRKKMREEASSQPQQPGSVVEELTQGIAGMPQNPQINMASGGIVGFAGGRQVTGSAEAQALMALLQKKRGGSPMSMEDLNRLVELSNQQSVDMGTSVYQDKSIGRDPVAKEQAMKGEGGYSYDPATKKYYGTQENRLLTQNLPAVTGEVGSDEYNQSLETKYAPLFSDKYPLQEAAPSKFTETSNDTSIKGAGLFGPTPRPFEPRNPQEEGPKFGDGGQMMSSALEGIIKYFTAPDQEDYYLPQQPIIDDIRGDNRRDANMPELDDGLSALASKMGVARDSELTVAEPAQAQAAASAASGDQGWGNADEFAGITEQAGTSKRGDGIEKPASTDKPAQESVWDDPAMSNPEYLPPEPTGGDPQLAAERAAAKKAAVAASTVEKPSTPSGEVNSFVERANELERRAANLEKQPAKKEGIAALMQDPMFMLGMEMMRSGAKTGDFFGALGEAGSAVGKSQAEKEAAVAKEQGLMDRAQLSADATMYAADANARYREMSSLSDRIVELQKLKAAAFGDDATQSKLQAEIETLQRRLNSMYGPSAEGATLRKIS